MQLSIKNALYLSFSLTLLILSCKSDRIEKHRVIYVNSYHRGHPSSDEIMDAVLAQFSSDSYDLRYYFMDTKRNTSEAFIKNKAAELADSIMSFKPEILIVSDDNAVKHLAQPNLDRFNIPVVFCGVNWTAEGYHLPKDKVTGMLEILPIDEVLRILLKVDPSISTMLALTENTTTSRKEAMLFDTLFTELGIKVTNELVDDFEDWKVAFSDGNMSYDVIYIPTHGAIKNWDHEAALEFVAETIKVPVVTCEDFMMPYCVFGLTKIASEQGDWAAITAKQILDGQKPQNIPIVSNKRYTTWLNSDMAARINFEIDTAELQNLKYVK